MENTTNETTNANSTEQVVANKKNILNYITPVAIIIAGVIIAGALYFRGDVTPNNNKDLINNALAKPKAEYTDIKSIDHMRGDKDAKVVIIEYSDIECPFCKIYHGTMKKIINEFMGDKQVAWVYRHFPISYGDNPLHKNAAKEAEATECAAELGGNDMFWAYTDAIYEATPSNDGLDLAELPKIATKVGLDTAKFTECLNSGKYADKVKASYDEALRAGAQGTPHTIIKYKGEFIPLVNDQGEGLGALPYDILKQIITQLLEQK